MKSIIVSTLALAVIVQLVQGELIKVTGFMEVDGGIFKWTKVEIEAGTTFRDLGLKICSDLKGKTSSPLVVKKFYDMFSFWDLNEKVEVEDFEDIDRVYVKCN